MLCLIYMNITGEKGSCLQCVSKAAVARLKQAPRRRRRPPASRRSWADGLFRLRRSASKAPRSAEAAEDFSPLGASLPRSSSESGAGRAPLAVLKFTCRDMTEDLRAQVAAACQHWLACRSCALVTAGLLTVSICEVMPRIAYCVRVLECMHRMPGDALICLPRACRSTCTRTNTCCSQNLNARKLL